MPSYHYRALDATGRRRRGRRYAATPLAPESELAHLDLTLLRCWTPASTRLHKLYARLGWTQRLPRVPRSEVIHFCTTLEQLLLAGVPLLEALIDLRDNTGGELHHTLAALAVEISAGRPFSEALTDFPQTFPSPFAELIHAAERSGKLNETLRDLGEHLRWRQALTNQIKQATLYPQIAALTTLAASTFLLLYLVPKLSEFITSTGYQLPWYSAALLASSSLLSQHGLALLGALGALLTASWIALHKSAALRHKRDRWLLESRLFGPLLLRLELARLCRCSALLYSAGVPLIETLELSQSLVRNRALYSALENARARITAGQNVAASLAQSGDFPPLFLRLIRVGEHSGALDRSLEQLAQHYTRELRERLAQLEQWLGPISILFIGALMLWLIAAIILPLIGAAVDLSTSQ